MGMLFGVLQEGIFTFSTTTTLVIHVFDFRHGNHWYSA